MTQRFVLLLLISCCWQFGACFLTGSRSECGLFKSKTLLRGNHHQDNPVIVVTSEDDKDDEKMARLSPQSTTLSSRRLFSQTAATMVLMSDIVGHACHPRAAQAAAPITAVEADNFLAKSQRLLRPKPPKALRPKLDQDFAVLLMRSSYNALDQLDCVAMVGNTFLLCCGGYLGSVFCLCMPWLSDASSTS